MLTVANTNARCSDADSGDGMAAVYSSCESTCVVIGPTIAARIIADGMHSAMTAPTKHAAANSLNFVFPRFSMKRLSFCTSVVFFSATEMHIPLKMNHTVCVAAVLKVVLNVDTPIAD